MSIIGLLITAFLPASAAVCIAIKKHVPVYALAAVFFAAAASLLPVLALQHSVHTFLDVGIAKRSEAVRLLFNSFITAAWIEEGVKTGFFGLTAAMVLKKDSGLHRVCCLAYSSALSLAVLKISRMVCGIPTCSFSGLLPPPYYTGRSAVFMHQWHTQKQSGKRRSSFSQRLFSTDFITFLFRWAAASYSPQRQYSALPAYMQHGLLRLRVLN